MKNTVSGNEARGFQKLIVDADTDTVLGIHMIGPDSAEIMQVSTSAVPTCKLSPIPKHLDGKVQSPAQVER